MKNFAVIKSEHTELINVIENRFKNQCKVLSKEDDLRDFDLIVLTGYETEFTPPERTEVINIHPSLLPSFKGENAIMQAFLSGVKVTGISIHRVEKDNFYGKIIAQYPVLIGLTTHIDELNEEISAVAKKLYPAVIDAVLNDRVFDFSDLFKSSCSKNNGCSNGCSGCAGHCKH